MKKKDKDKSWKVLHYIILINIVGAIPAFIIFLHAFKTLSMGLHAPTSEYIQLYFEKSNLVEHISFAYIAVTLLASFIYSFICAIPGIIDFFNLNDPVTVVTASIFVVCLIYDLINKLNFSATKFGVGLFIGTLVKEKFKSLRKSGENI